MGGKRGKAAAERTETKSNVQFASDLGRLEYFVSSFSFPSTSFSPQTPPAELRSISPTERAKGVFAPGLLSVSYPFNTNTHCILIHLLLAFLSLLCRISLPLQGEEQKLEVLYQPYSRGCHTRTSTDIKQRLYYQHFCYENVFYFSIPYTASTGCYDVSSGFARQLG